MNRGCRLVSRIPLGFRRLKRNPNPGLRNILCRRYSPLALSKEVTEALKNNVPVVALESTIITHGMPYPQNEELAIQVESKVRSMGAVPATIALLNGQCTIGLEQFQLSELAKSGETAYKVSRRDLSYVASQRLNGGTTVAATMILARAAGIDVFATGGIGGVHRGAENSMDISADLIELGRTRVAVVSAGVKSILDIGRTLEVLETQGVPVVTLGPPKSAFPAFFSRESKFQSPLSLETPQLIANMLFSNIQLGQECGTLVAIPTPHHCSIDYEKMEALIETCLQRSVQLGITGKNVTPWLLGELLRESKGKSLNTNIDLVLNNAEKASLIAKELAVLKEKSSFFPTNTGNTFETKPVKQDFFYGKVSDKGVSSSKKKITETTSKPAEVVCVGSVSIDSVLKLDNPLTSKFLGTSHPCHSEQAFGGVAHNMALASSLMGASTKLVSCVGTKSVPTSSIKEYLTKSSLQHTIVEKSNFTSCSYTAINDCNGNLLLAGADMAIMENLSYSEIKDDLNDAKYICFDGNISPSLMLDITTSKSSKQRVVFEPTSGPKTLKILKVLSVASIDFITPNKFELDVLFQAMKDGNFFENESWWQKLNSFGITSSFYNEIERFTKSTGIEEITENGILQKCFHLLPFIKNIIVKLGPNGALLISSEKLQGVNSNSASLFTPGNVTVKYYPVPKVIATPVNASGTGDTFIGTFTALLSKGWGMDDAIDTAQKAAGLTLQCNFSVNPEIKTLLK